MDLEKTYANYLDNEGVSAIQALEKETNTLIMAYATPSVPAELSPEQLKKIEELENKLCVRLVAYKTH
jgi:uncharacterized coiled-coil DUF342 family protein